MTISTRLTSRGKGNENAFRLEKWIKTTAISKVPLNQFGQAAKLSICRILNIPYSTVGTNKKLSELFSELNTLIKSDSLHPISSQKQKNDGPAPSPFYMQMTDLLAENEALKNKLARLQYLEDTGILA